MLGRNWGHFDHVRIAPAEPPESRAAKPYGRGWSICTPLAALKTLF